MACFVNMIAVFIFSLLGHVRANTGAQVQANDNAEKLALLCRIYNVAKNPPINHVNLQDPLEIVNEINALNASLAEEKQFSGAEQMENSSVAQLQSTVIREVAVAQAILKRIARRAHTILEDIQKVNATNDIEKIKAEFNKVIFGEGMNESDLCKGSLKGVVDRGNTCGIPGLAHKGENAGKNLLVDFSAYVR
ncbi:unnamed protein product [Trypanosoma congolense IL3000]|uniref:WGS project CAEQ00000000 data, annotated contig 49 n=1 Tax=Trypanosoma congolense (strain IL3000) TaxID=1068625 RepID=F9WGE0_TRYCI|nr:unnamed protein product [Trypanosoma congolense IL3000]